MSATTRRSFLASAAGVAASAVAQRVAAAEGQTSDQMLDELMRENQDNDATSFDNASRNVRLPKKSLPTLSPSTAETTQTSIAHYETIVAKGGWPDVPPSADGLRVGAKGPAVPALRQRLSIAGDLELNSGDPAVFDSYVDAAV